MDNPENAKKKLEEIELAMQKPDFWQDKEKAKTMIAKMQELKDIIEGKDEFDSKGSVLTILAGAGGDDAEDFTRMLLNMYLKYFENKNWNYRLLHENKNDHDGYRNVTIEVSTKNSYAFLKHENGVHRLVRLSPFNSNQKRHTSFAMVEVTPLLDKKINLELRPEDITIEFQKTGGPGGQNVNKRETGVRVTHNPTGISVYSSSERTQEANREQALSLLNGKLLNELKKAKVDKIESLKISKSTQIEWGNQIRNYVLHPYKLIKDLRSNYEEHNVEKVLERGELDDVITSLSQLEQ